MIPQCTPPCTIPYVCRCWAPTVSSARTSSWVAWVIDIPISCGQPPIRSFICSARSSVMSVMVADTQHVDGKGECSQRVRGRAGERPAPLPLSPDGERVLTKTRLGPGRPGPSCRRSQCFRLRLQEPDPEMEALEAYFLPSSRLANEAAGTTIRFIQASASPPLPHGQ